MYAKTRIEPGGTWKRGDRLRSVVRAWRMVRLTWIPIGVAKRMPVDQSGRILIRVLRSSTCLTLHSFHGCFAMEPSALMSSSVLSAARFRSLESIQEHN